MINGIRIQEGFYKGYGGHQVGRVSQHNWQTLETLPHIYWKCWQYFIGTAIRPLVLKHGVQPGVGI